MRKTILNALHRIVHFLLYLILIIPISLLKGIIAVLQHLLANAQKLENPTPPAPPAA